MEDGESEFANFKLPTLKAFLEARSQNVFGNTLTFQPTTDSHHHFLILLQLSIITCLFLELIYGHLHIVWGKVKKEKSLISVVGIDVPFGQNVW